jgi:hypothetical protein
MNDALRTKLVVFFLFGLGAYGIAVSKLLGFPHLPALEEMRVAMPRFAQVLLAGGDRYLAANINTVRALVASTEGLAPDQFEIQARVQKDASWLNPAQQDNYYLAAGILSWNGQLETAQTILSRAHSSRPFDIWPAFYYAFHEWHYNKKPLEGVRWLRLAAERAPGYLERVSLLDMAARWAGTSDDLGEAIRVVQTMAAGTRDQVFRNYLLKRVGRLEALRELRMAATSFYANSGRRPQHIDDLIRPGLLTKLPLDPFGEGFVLDADGVPVVAGSRIARKN